MKYTREQLSRILSEQCGNGMTRSGYGATKGNNPCIEQVALNSNNFFAGSVQTRTVFDNQYFKRWTPEELLAWMELRKLA